MMIAQLLQQNQQYTDPPVIIHPPNPLTCREDETEVPFIDWIKEVEDYAERTKQDKHVTLRKLLREGALHYYLELDDETRRNWD